MKRSHLYALLAMAALGFTMLTPSSAQAHWPFGGYGGYYAPYAGYYGNGGHDLTSHWHTTTTPFGGYSYYGNGLHDLLPHQHVATPWSHTGYSYSPWGATQSYYSTPYGYYGSGGYGYGFRGW